MYKVGGQIPGVPDLTQGWTLSHYLTLFFSGRYHLLSILFKNIEITLIIYKFGTPII